MSDTVRTELLIEIVRAAHRLGAKSDLISAIGSWGDTMEEDHQVLDALLRWNDRRQRGRERDEATSIENAIRQEIYQALQSLGAPPELLGPVGSWGDTYDDAQTLEDVRRFNRTGSIFDRIDVHLPPTSGRE